MLATQRHAWEQGVAMQALDAIGAESAMLALARAAVATTAVSDGRVAVIDGSDTGTATDPCACGIPLRRAYELTGDEQFARARAGLEAWALERAPRRADGVVYHEVERPRIWVDSFFMLPPFLADGGHLDAALTQVRGYWGALHDERTGLLFHMWDEAERRLGWPNLWATGNGWALAGLAQVIDRVPPERPDERVELVGLATSLVTALVPFQRADGLFHTMVDRPETFADAAGACLVAYGMLRGLAAGWLDEAHRPMAERIRSAADAGIDRYGFLSPVVGAPDFARPGLSAEAQAAYLLMVAAADAAT